MTKTLTDRGTLVCRGCGHDELLSVLDLGEQPLANEMSARPDAVIEAFPLHLRVCPSCGLGQVGEYVLPDRIFGDAYPYLSSASSSWVAHAQQYADLMIEMLALDAGDLVMEVASNDGYLLRALQDRGIRVLGIEPAANVAAIAQARGVPTVNRFFGKATAASIVEEHGLPSLVVANNVMAHVPDLVDFTSGLATLCGPDTTITVENPSFLTLLREGQFDTIYHEHFSYLSAHAVSAAVEPRGLELVRVDELPTHGGSNRYWLRRFDSHDADDSVESIRDRELSGGLFDPAAWKGFAAGAKRAIEGLGAWLDERSDAGRRVAAYGAAAKGNTFLNAVGPAAASIALAVDASPEKQGRYMPGSRIPVFAPEQLTREDVDDVIVLPWNLVDEIAPLVLRLAPEANVWVAIPEMREVS